MEAGNVDVDLEFGADLSEGNSVNVEIQTVVSDFDRRVSIVGLTGGILEGRLYVGKVISHPVIKLRLVQVEMALKFLTEIRRHGDVERDTVWLLVTERLFNAAQRTGGHGLI